MKLFPKMFLVCVVLSFAACSQINQSGSGGSDITATTGSEDALYIGHWLSDCVDLGGGNISRIYTEIESDLKINLAFLTYTDVNCVGTFTLTDNLGSTITEAKYTQDFSQEAVTDIPDNFFVLKITDITTFAVQYVVYYVNDHEFYELIGFGTPHDTWTQWQGEADVFNFAVNPFTYEPTTFTKYHFTKSELP